MAPPEVNDRDVPREDVVDESLMPHCSNREDISNFFEKLIKDKAKDQLTAQPKTNFGFKKAANGFFPGRPSPPYPINLHHSPKDVRLYHKHLLSDYERDPDVLRCIESKAFTYLISKDSIEIQSNIPPSSEISVPSSTDLFTRNDQPQSNTGAVAIVYGIRIQKSGRETWEAPDVSSVCIKRHMKELFEIQSKSAKLVFGGYEGLRDPYIPPPAKARGWITTLSKELQMKYDNSLLSSDQRSNRNRKKVEKGACFSSDPASSPFLDERAGPLLGKHHSEAQLVNHQSDHQKQYPYDQQHQKRQTAAHHSASSSDPSGSTQSPSPSQSEGNESTGSPPNTQQRKRGISLNQRDGTFNRESLNGKESSDGLPCGEDSRLAVNVLAQAKENVAFEQKLHLCVSEELLASAGTKIPPDKAANKNVTSQASSHEPPGTEVQSQISPHLHSETAKVRPRQNTATTLEIKGVSKNQTLATQDDASNQLWGLFNVKPPPHSQASHDAEISLPEIEWNGSATKSSTSVDIQLREYGLKDSEVVQEKPFPGNELLLIEVAAEEINKDIIKGEPVQIQKLPSCAPEAQAGHLDSLPTVNQHALNEHSLFGPSEDESAAEFFGPIPFSSSAGDDSFCPLQPSRQVCKQQEVVTSKDGEIYQHPVEEAGQPSNTQMVVSKPTLPADWMQLNHPPPQATTSLSLCLLSYTTRGSCIILSPFSDFWGFTTLVDVDEYEQIL